MNLGKLISSKVNSTGIRLTLCISLTHFLFINKQIAEMSHLGEIAKKTALFDKICKKKQQIKQHHGHH